MGLKNKIKRLFIYSSALFGGVVVTYLLLKTLPKTNDFQYLPTESILKRQIQQDIQISIHNALVNLMDKSDFELAVHVNLNQDEITEEMIKYEPKEVSIQSLTKNMSSIPRVNALPGLIDNPFHNESLPGFPSYFDQFDIDKDDYVTRGLLAKILSTAYQLPNNDLIPNETTDIIDANETEFSDSVKTIVNEDILKLYQTGEFRPNEFISKISLITALVRINYPTTNAYSQDVISDVPYKDIPKTHWAYNYVKTALEHKLIEEDILFNPNEKVTVESVLSYIEKTPLRSDVFNYYKFPKKDAADLFKTDNKQEVTQSNVYYNQEKTFFKSPSTKIKNISIRLMVNDVILSEEITLESIEDIVRSVVDIDETRNDSFVIKSFRFTNLPFLTRIYKWHHWQKIYILILLSILGYSSNRLYVRYKKFKLNQEKILSLKKQREEKLARIHEEEEIKAYSKMKQEIIHEAAKNTPEFTLKLEKWLELLMGNPQVQEKPEIAYEKIALVILFVDFERPGLSTEIIKRVKSDYIKDTILGIENISKIETEKVKTNILEFHSSFMSPETIFGGKTTSNYIIDNVFSEKEKQQIFNIEQEEAFGFIEHVKTNKIKEFLVNENEVVAAFLLNKCSEERMLEITEILPSIKLKTMAKHLISVKNNPCELMDKFEALVKEKLVIGETTSEASKNKMQIQKASSVFETLPKDVRASIFSNLQENDPETLSLIQAEMFMFEDIELLTDVDMQSLIFDVKDMELLATALFKSPNELTERFKQNFSDRFASQFESAQQRLGEMDEVEDEKIDKAQYEIIRSLRQLEKNERITNLKELKRSNQ
ncbi:MAG: S-layer homology domain-containing protein [Candidatus Margulisbacteria bacterium]|nr:S-layer homology domain-containing protein [Candidatus Margulisiibacteriota bacterium]